MKITDLKAGVEYAARLYPHSPEIVSHIRLLGTTKTADYHYSAGWGGDRVRTKALPAVYIQDDGTETEGAKAVLPKHIFSTWEDYLPTHTANMEEKARRAMFVADAEKEIVVSSTPEGSAAGMVVWASGLAVARFNLMGVIADSDYVQDAAEHYASKLRRRFVALAMGTTQEVSS